MVPVWFNYDLYRGVGVGVGVGVGGGGGRLGRPLK